MNSAKSKQGVKSYRTQNPNLRVQKRLIIDIYSSTVRIPIANQSFFPSVSSSLPLAILLVVNRFAISELGRCFLAVEDERKGVPGRPPEETFLSTEGLEDRGGDFDVRVLPSPLPPPALAPFELTGETAPRAPPRLLTRGPRGPRGPPGPPGELGPSLSDEFRWSEARAAATRPLGTVGETLTGEVEREDDVPPEAALPRRPVGVKFTVVGGTVVVWDGFGEAEAGIEIGVVGASGGVGAGALVRGGMDSSETGAGAGTSGFDAEAGAGGCS